MTGDGCEQVAQVIKQLPEERTRQILRERARALSQPLEGSDETPGKPILVCSVGDDRVGIELPFVREVLPLPGVVEVPHTPQWLLGVMNYRGRVLAVVSLRYLLELPGQEGDAASQRLLLLELPGATLGLAVDALDGISHAEVVPSPASGSSQLQGRASLVSGIAPGGVALLDVTMLARLSTVAVGD